jgi:hypothetical protein
MKRRTCLTASIVLTLFSMFALADDGGRNDNNGHNGNNNNGNNNNGQNGKNSFNSSVVGSSPGTMVGGVPSGGAPWVVNQGSAQISPNGQLEVDVTGLLLGLGAPPNLVGTVGPVQMVAASLVCGGSGGTVVASTGAVFLDASGRADIQDVIAVPASCIAPSILIRIFNPAAPAGSQLGAFIASTGIAAGTNAANQDNDNRDHHDN